MEAIIATQPFQLAEGQKFEKVSRELPTPEAHDILIKVYATGINPVDTKMRQAPLNAEARVLGFDAAGWLKRSAMRLRISNRVTEYIIQDRINEMAQIRRISS